MRPTAVLDAALEATVVGSFSSIGYGYRSRVGHWNQDFDLTGTRVLLTGGTSGIGLAAATRLAACGATVAITGRDPDRLDAAAEAISGTGLRPVTIVSDAADLDQVCETFDTALDALGGIDVLINNAGALTAQFVRTPQGFEQTYAVHVLAPFLLTRLALPTVGKVITMSSGGMYTQGLAADMQMAAADYDGVRAYAMAKRAQVVLNEVWATRYPDGPVFAAMHPGWADTPGVQDALPGFQRLMRPILRTPEQGADTLVWLTAAEVPTGGFWLDRQERTTVRLPWTPGRATPTNRPRPCSTQCPPRSPIGDRPATYH